MIGHGLAVLDNLRTQHVSLRGVKRKMLDIGSAVSSFICFFYQLYYFSSVYPVQHSV